MSRAVPSRGPRRRAVVVALAVAALSVPLAACDRDDDPPGGETPLGVDLYVSGFFAANVQRFEGPLAPSPGAPAPAPGQSGAVYAPRVSRRPWGVAFGPDGHLYVANQQGAGAIMRVAGPASEAPGAHLPAPGQMDAVLVPDGNALALTFGPDGKLYAVSGGHVRRYEPATGALIDVFTNGRAPAEASGLLFGPDGHLYVSSFDSCVMDETGCTGSRGEILRYDGQTGAFLGTFVGPGVGGLSLPGGLAWTPAGDLWVTDANLGAVLRFRGPARADAGAPAPAPGQAGAIFAARESTRPLALAVSPGGELFVSTTDAGGGGAGEVLRFNGTSGEWLATFATVEGGPRGLAFFPR